MTARAFLVRGLVAGLLAGIAAFVVAYGVGEPYVQRAIDLEESSAAPRAESPSFTVNQAAVLTHDGSHEEGTVASVQPNGTVDEGSTVTVTYYGPPPQDVGEGEGDGNSGQGGGNSGNGSSGNGNSGEGDG